MHSNPCAFYLKIALTIKSIVVKKFKKVKQSGFYLYKNFSKIHNLCGLHSYARDSTMPKIIIALNSLKTP